MKNSIKISAQELENLKNTLNGHLKPYNDKNTLYDVYITDLKYSIPKENYDLDLILSYIYGKKKNIPANLDKMYKTYFLLNVFCYRNFSDCNSGEEIQIKTESTSDLMDYAYNQCVINLGYNLNGNLREVFQLSKNFGCASKTDVFLIELENECEYELNNHCIDLNDCQISNEKIVEFININNKKIMKKENLKPEKELSVYEKFQLAALEMILESKNGEDFNIKKYDDAVEIKCLNANTQKACCLMFKQVLFHRRIDAVAITHKDYNNHLLKLINIMYTPDYL